MASIKYKGEVIKRITSGQSVILHTEGHTLEGDIEIEGFDGQGTCERKHIFEVDELPSINIDTTALYECDGRYYWFDGGDWHEYIIPSGSATIIKNGTYDVTDIKKANVAVQTYIIVPSENDLPEDVDEGTIAVIAVMGE